MGTIAKITAGGTTHLVASSAYGTCSTAANTVAKVVTMADFDTLIAGMTIHVYMTNSNTAASPTLNVNSKGAKPIYKYGTTVPGTTAATSWQAGSIVSFTYNTTANTNGCWIMNDHLDDNNNTYTAATAAPKMDGTAAVGSSAKYAREDHVHPSDTSKVDKVAGKGLSTNDFTDALETKLNGIAAGAEVNVQSDWNETNTSSDAFIKNKPTIPTKTSDLTNDSDFVSDANYVHTDNNFTATEKNKLADIPSGAEANVQSDWNETDTTSDAYILNKPSISTDAVVDITRNGTTFTATKADGTSFTFDQQDNDSMPHYDVTESELNSKEGNYTFSGSGAPWEGTDWVGLQVGDNKDKFQLTVNENQLLVRQNDSGGDDSTNWTQWAPMYGLGVYHEIPQNADLNSYTTIGMYHSPSNAWASTVTNTPVAGIAFKMYVEKTIANNYLRQTCIMFNNGNVYTRTSTDGGSTWGSWLNFSADTKYPIYTQTKDKGDIQTKFTTWMTGSSENKHFLTIARIQNGDTGSFPSWCTGLGWGGGDTKGYLMVNYGSAHAYIGGGSGETLRWVKRISLDGECVKKTGDTMTGNLTVAGTAKSPYVAVKSPNGLQIILNASDNSNRIGLWDSKANEWLLYRQYISGTAGVNYMPIRLYIQTATDGQLTMYNTIGKKYGYVGVGTNGHLIIYTENYSTTTDVGGNYVNLRVSERVQVRNTGDTGWRGIAAETYATMSSRRFKENIEHITDNRAEKILNVDVVTYDYKEGEMPDSSRFDRTGVIAEDVNEVIPEVVGRDENGVIDSIDYSRFVPYLIRMVQIQEDRIKILEEKIKKYEQNMQR